MACWGGNALPFFAPLGLMAALLIWVMPEVRQAPVKLLDRLFAAFIFALLAWPDYLALTLPGTPWITAVRLVGVPLVLTLLICAFGSPDFRARMARWLGADVVIVRLLLVFLVIATLSVGLSSDKSGSLNRLAVAAMAWFGTFFAACHYFRLPGRPRRFVAYLYVILLISLAIGLYEARYSQLPWAGRVPWFLNVENPIVDKLLAGTVRAASGLYRVQSKFATSIGFGEFMAMVLPFLLHWLFVTRTAWLRAAIVMTIPVMFYIVIRTDSRLAFVGFCSSIFIYVLLGAAMRWQRDRGSIIAPALVVAYPVLLGLFITLSIFWRRLYVMIWGGGAQQFSTQSRQEQLRIGLPKVFQNPFGYGIGQGAQTLNYYAPGSDMLTIDSYYLAAALEFGILGFVIYYGMFVWATGRAALQAFLSNDEDVLYLAPTAVALVNFLLSKSIYSQTENHPLAFMLLGLVVALSYRYQNEARGGQPPL